MDFLKRTWAEIDLTALQENYRTIRALVDPAATPVAVVKADAYGHGAVECGKALAQAGAEWMAVSNIDEALQLRRAGLTTPILILGYTPPDMAGVLAEQAIVQTLLDGDYAASLSRAAAKAKVTVTAHLKIDTGMSRIGFWFHDAEQDAACIDDMVVACSLPHLRVEGIFTHFASADEPSGVSFTDRQHDAFIAATKLLEQRGITFRYRHCCNSAATIDRPAFHHDMVRPGLILYGLVPDASIAGKVPLRPVMQLKTVISMLKTVPAGTPVSYGRTFVTARETRVATVPIGYADGYPRACGNKGYMLVNGQKAPVIGRVCMDQCLLDVTDIDGVTVGMTVTVFGTDHGAYLPVEQLAAWQDTISYEIICLIGKRVPRIYGAPS